MSYGYSPEVWIFLAIFGGTLFYFIQREVRLPERFKNVRIGGVHVPYDKGPAPPGMQHGFMAEIMDIAQGHQPYFAPGVDGSRLRVDQIIDLSDNKKVALIENELEKLRGFHRQAKDAIDEWVKDGMGESWWRGIPMKQIMDQNHQILVEIDKLEEMKHVLLMEIR